MNLVLLIGRHLKSGEVIDLLERWEAEVVYDFDRLHEGTPDGYHSSLPEAGLELVFDASQVLTTVFVHLQSDGDFSSFDLKGSDIEPFDSVEAVRQFATSEDLVPNQGSSSFDGVERDWIRLEWSTHSVHYEFIEDRLHLVTITMRQAVT